MALATIMSYCPTLSGSFSHGPRPGRFHGEMAPDTPRSFVTAMTSAPLASAHWRPASSSRSIRLASVLSASLDNRAATRTLLCVFVLVTAPD